jgi:probable HAF family extracellular repeat protein
MGISADGSTVVGYASTSGFVYRAFRWTADGGMQSLGTLQGGFSSRAFAASANGSVVVGWSYNADRQLRAFRWTADGGMQSSARWAAL